MSLFGMEKGLWEKSIFFSSSFHSYIGKSTIQAEARSWFSSMRPSSWPIFCRAAPANVVNFAGLPADEEDGVAVLRARAADGSRRCAPAPMFLAIGPAPSLAVAEEDVAEARLPLALRPRIHAVAEGAVAAASAPGIAQTSTFGSRCDHAGEDLEAGAGEMLGHLLHLDRVAEVRLVGAVFPHRLARRGCAGTSASPACRRRTPRTRRGSPAPSPGTRRPASTKLISTSSW